MQPVLIRSKVAWLCCGVGGCFGVKMVSSLHKSSSGNQVLVSTVIPNGQFLCRVSVMAFWVLGFKVAHRDGSSRSFSIPKEFSSFWPGGWIFARLLADLHGSCACTT